MRRFYKICVSTLFIFVLSVCIVFAGGTKERKVEKVPEGPIEINWWGFVAEDGDVMKECLDILKSRGEIPENVELKITAYGFEELYDKILAIFTAGGTGAPDFVEVEISQAGRFYKQDPIGFMDLTQRINNSPYYEDQIISRAAPYSYKGRIYGIDMDLSLSMIYYRKDIFDQYNIKVPIETWDDYIKAGLELKKHGIYMVEVPNGANPDNFNEDFVPQLLIQQGGGYFDKNGNVIVNNQIGVRTITFINDMVNKYGIALASASDIFDPPFYAPYNEGKVATFIMPSWMLEYFMKPNMPDLSGKWRIMPLPAWEKGGVRTSTAGGTSLMITRFTKYPDIAWKLFEFNRMAKEGGLIGHKKMGYFPPIKSLLNDPQIIKPDEYIGGQSIGEYFKTYAPSIPEYYLSPFWWDGHLLMASEVLYPVITGKISPKVGLDNMALKLKQLMEQ